jgi:hypothetical protein
MTFLAIVRRMTTRDEDKHRPHIFTIKASPRLSRELWEEFRAVAERRGEFTIDALRRALELYIAQEPPQ